MDIHVFTHLLEHIFKDVIMDGSTSFVPGQEEENSENPEEEQEDGQEDEDTPIDSFSPMSTSNSRKRSSNTTSTAKSPEKQGKKTKSHVVKIITSYSTESSKNASFRNDLLERAVERRHQYMSTKISFQE